MEYTKMQLICLHEHSKSYWIGNSYYESENGVLQQNTFPKTTVSRYFLHNIILTKA